MTEQEIRGQVLPQEGEVLGVVQKLLGYDRVMVKCVDGHMRLCRIRGKMKRRVWVREGDIVSVAPWDFQSESRGDIIWRYTEGQAEELKKKGELQAGVGTSA